MSALLMLELLRVVTLEQHVGTLTVASGNPLHTHACDTHFHSSEYK